MKFTTLEAIISDIHSKKLTNLRVEFTFMARLIALVVLLSLEALTVDGQHRAFDSLRQALAQSSSDSGRVDILNQLSHAYYDYNSREGLRYADEALTLASTLDYLKGKRRALTLKGFYYNNIGDYREALRYYNRSRAVNLPEDDLVGYNYIMTANVYRAMALYDSAHLYYDSAIELLTKGDSPVQLAFAYRNLGRLHLVRWENTRAEEFLLKALEIYKRSDHRYGMSDTYFWLAEEKKNISDYRSANEYVRAGCAMAKEVNDEFLLLRCLISEGNIHSQLGQYTLALTKYFEALGILQSKDLTLVLSSVYADIGDVYRVMGQYPISLKYYAEALEIAERIGVKYELAKLYIGMASIFSSQRDFQQAHEYAEKSLSIRKELGDEFGVANSLNIQGTIYYKEGKYEAAIQSLNQSLAIRKTIDHREGISASLYNLSLVFAARKEFQKALQFQQQGLTIEESIGNEFSIAYSHNRLGSLYTQLGRFRQAEAHLKRAETIGRRSASRVLLMNNNLNWAAYYETRKDPARALRYYKLYNDNKDSTFNDLGAQKLAELQALYTVEKKDHQIRLLEQEQKISKNEIEIQRAQINRQNTILVFVVVSLILVTLLLYSAFRYSTRLKRANLEISEQKEKIQSQSEELLDANRTIADINKKLEDKIEDRTQALSQAYKELDTFFYRSSHDFRRPLTTFLGLAEVAKVTVKDTNALELFDKVRETASNLDKMLVKLQSISDMGTQQLVYKEVMIKAIFDTVCDNFRDDIQRRGIKASAEVNLRSPFTSYPAMVRIIIENLVENAIQFCGTDRPFIRLKATQSGDYVTIDLQDNGQGIGREYHDQVFDMYFRGNERSKGNGLGLYIVRKAVEKLNGSISFSSIPLVGSTFTIMLPRSL